LTQVISGKATKKPVANSTKKSTKDRNFISQEEDDEIMINTDNMFNMISADPKSEFLFNWNDDNWTIELDRLRTLTNAILRKVGSNPASAHINEVYSHLKRILVMEKRLLFDEDIIDAVQSFLNCIRENFVVNKQNQGARIGFAQEKYFTIIESLKIVDEQYRRSEQNKDTGNQLAGHAGRLSGLLRDLEKVISIFFHST
jgi:hypothetical protein